MEKNPFPAEEGLAVSSVTSTGVAVEEVRDGTELKRGLKPRHLLVRPFPEGPVTQNGRLERDAPRCSHVQILGK